MLHLDNLDVTCSWEGRVEDQMLILTKNLGGERCSIHEVHGQFFLFFFFGKKEMSALNFLSFFPYNMFMTLCN